MRPRTHRLSIRFWTLLLALSLVTLALAQSPSRPDTFKPVVRGKRGVVAAGQPLSAEAGMRMLLRGGNAVDAGVASVFAASVIEFSHFAFGGEVALMIKPAGEPVTTINGQGIW